MQRPFAVQVTLLAGTAVNASFECMDTSSHGNLNVYPYLLPMLFHVRIVNVDGSSFEIQSHRDALALDGV